MKPNLAKGLSILFFAAVLAACATTPVQKSESEFRASYPSQFIVGDTYILKSHEKINGNVVGLGTTLIIEKDALVMGDISLIGSNLNLYGRVAGEINLLAGSSEIRDTAIITGNINQAFQNNNIAPKALINGEINTYSFPTFSGQDSGKGIATLIEWLRPTRIIALQIARLIVLVLSATIGIYLLKTPTFNAASAIRSNAPAAWGAGLLTLVAIPLVAIVLIISICLSPVGILLIIAYGICNLWGFIALSSVLGTLMMKWFKLNWPVEPATIFGAFILGMVSIVISFIPCIGFLINLMITAAGLGGILLSKFGRESA